MACQTIYAEMMSLHLDGQLDDDDERHLIDHLMGCAICSPFWVALQEVDALFMAAAHTPLSVPAGLQSSIMVRIAAASVSRQELAIEAVPEPVYSVPRITSVLPSYVPAAGVFEPLPPVQMPDYLQRWQQRVSGYLRGMTAVGLTVTLAAGLLLVLLVSGVLQVGPLNPMVEGVRTFISAVYTWGRSLISSAGTEVAVGAAFLVSLLVFAGWQIVTGYQRATARQMPEPVQAEAATQLA